MRVVRGKDGMPSSSGWEVGGSRAEEKADALTLQRRSLQVTGSKRAEERETGEGMFFYVWWARITRNKRGVVEPGASSRSLSLSSSLLSSSLGGGVCVEKRSEDV